MPDDAVKALEVNLLQDTRGLLVGALVAVKNEGRSTSPCLSTKVQPIIWPLSATTAMSAAFTCATSACVDSQTARHQWAGSCSAQLPLK